MNAIAKIVPASDAPSVFDIERLSGALHRAAIAYAAVPNYPICQSTKETAKALFDETAAELRTMLEAMQDA